MADTVQEVPVGVATPDGEQAAAGTISAAAPEDQRLRTHWPGLDGLRGLAVCAVLVFHSGFGFAKGGFLSVPLFFALSGFLITTLVIGERERSGRVSLSAFWARRARRLLPASYLALLLGIVCSWLVLPAADRLTAMGDIRMAAINLANWRFIGSGAGYVDVNSLPSPVLHYWSLAIEEQFYILFPVVAAVALRFRRGGLAVVFTGLVVLGIWRQRELDDVTRVYFGTDTRAAEIALGGLLALGRERIVATLTGWRRWIPDACGVVALVAILLVWWRVDFITPALYDGGLTMVGLVCTVLVFGAVEGRYVPRLLANRFLVWMGLISYGTYLFHFPIFLVVDEDRTGLSSWPLFAARMAVTLGLAVASYNLVERPIRRSTALPGQRSTVAFATGLVVVLAAAWGVTARLDSQGVSADSDIDVAVGAAVTAPPGAPPAPHVVVLGDSTAAVIGEGLQAWGAETGRLRVSTVSGAGCAPYPGTRTKIREGYELSPRGCEGMFGDAVDVAEEQGADAIVVFLGSSQLSDWRYEGSSEWHDVFEPVVQRGVEAGIQGALDTLGRAGVPVLWADIPEPSWDLEVFAEQLGGPLPGDGPVLMNDPERAQIVNRILLDVVGADGGALVLPWTEHLAGPDGTVPASLRPDGLHLDDEQVDDVAEGFLFDQLDRSYDEAIASIGGLAPPRDHAWSR